LPVGCTEKILKGITGDPEEEERFYEPMGMSLREGPSEG